MGEGHLKVLVVGSGGREHALLWKLSRSPLVGELYCAPGNPGTAMFARNVQLNPTNTGALALWALENKIDLTVVGPEAPLEHGLADVFLEHGLKLFGPVRAAAKLESSKVFSKEVMKKAGIRTARAEIFSDYQAARHYVEQQGAPIVLKADGLCAGKGVVVAENVDEALAALHRMMVEKCFGRAGETVVIEEMLSGREASVMAIVDGHTVIPLVVSQDYKRLNEGDSGPNTGGMGAISPTPVLADSAVEQLTGEIFVPVLGELWARGINYTGFLYAGVMVDRSGNVNVLEFNCRLGDPETQVLMLRLQSDLVAVLMSAVTGDLASVDLEWSHEHACCVVAASRGYPGEVVDGKTIRGLFEPEESMIVFQAGTAPGKLSSEVVSKGGRVLSVTGKGRTAQEARDKAYRGMSYISFEGMHYRKDIGGGNSDDKR